MRNSKLNRRAVLIAFIVAALVGAGGQAVALWQQSSTLTAEVSFGKMPAPIISCAGDSHKVDMVWRSGHPGVIRYDVGLLKDGVPVGAGYSSGETLNINSNQQGVQPGQIWTMTVAANYPNGWQSETATYRFRTAADGNKAVLACS